MTGPDSWGIGSGLGGFAGGTRVGNNNSLGSPSSPYAPPISDPFPTWPEKPIAASLRAGKDEAGECPIWTP